MGGGDISGRHMQRTLGLGLFAVGVLGYVVGVYVAYPGRGVTVAAVMVGLTLVAIGDPATTGGR